MRIRSAGILLYRKRKHAIEVFLVHPGGPYWRKKDEGAWSIPKGTINPGEDPEDAAWREFREETGFEIDGKTQLLGTFRQPGGKDVTAYTIEGDCDAERLVSNTFSLLWPPRSGTYIDFPEADRGAWFPLAEAEIKILKGQKQILEKFRSTVD